MKQRLLVKLLNDTKYNVANYDKYIAVGSPLCHDLVKVKKDTLELTYALNNTSFRGEEKIASDKKYLRNNSYDELLFIYETLDRLIKSGEIKDIIDGCDELENPMVIYTVKLDYDTFETKLLKTFIEQQEWPRVDKKEGLSTKTMCGDQAYNNTHFKTIEEACHDAISEQNSWRVIFSEQIEDLQQKINERKVKIEKIDQNIKNLQNEKIHMREQNKEV